MEEALNSQQEIIQQQQLKALEQEKKLKKLEQEKKQQGNRDVVVGGGGGGGLCSAQAMQQTSTVEGEWAGERVTSKVPLFAEHDDTARQVLSLYYYPCLHSTIISMMYCSFKKYEVI